MTIIIETNKKTFARLKIGELTMIVHEFNKQVKVSDTIIFQETEDGKEYKDWTGEELSFKVTQIETEGCKTGFSAVAFKEMSVYND